MPSLYNYFKTIFLACLGPTVNLSPAFSLFLLPHSFPRFLFTQRFSFIQNDFYLEKFTSVEEEHWRRAKDPQRSMIKVNKTFCYTGKPIIYRTKSSSKDTVVSANNTYVQIPIQLAETVFWACVRPRPLAPLWKLELCMNGKWGNKWRFRKRDNGENDHWQD